MTTSLSPSTPSPVEAAIVASVDRQMDAALELLERTVNINSGTMNFAGVRAVGDLFQRELDALGFETRWQDGAAFSRAGHLVAERRAGVPAPLRVLLIGHLDTVYELDHPFQRFERLDEGHARGPGIIDMKGGNVIICVVLRALLDAGLLDRFHVSVMLAGDEEDTGAPLEASRAALREMGARADVAIGFEDGSGRLGSAVIARRGSGRFTLKVKGRAAHSSLILGEEVGAGAIYELARVLDGFRRALDPSTYCTFNPGFVVGGTAIEVTQEQTRGRAAGKDNVVAEHALASGDIRTSSPELLAATKQTMRAITAASLPHTTTEVTFEDGYLPVVATDGNRKLLAVLDEVSRDLGYGPVEAVDPRKAGAADISFVAAGVAMNLDGVGLRGSGGHTVEETADLSTLPKQSKRIAVTLARLLAG